MSIELSSLGGNVNTFLLACYSSISFIAKLAWSQIGSVVTIKHSRGPSLHFNILSQFVASKQRLYQLGEYLQLRTANCANVFVCVSKRVRNNNISRVGSMQSIAASISDSTNLSNATMVIPR